MRWALLAVTALAASLSWLAAADDPPQPAAGRDVQDLVFLGDSRPLLIRLHVQIDGRPFREAWDAFLGRLFDYLDQDRDGVLSQAEIDRVPRPEFLLTLARGSSFMPAQTARQSPDLGVSLVAGKVTRQGLAGYYHLSGVEPLYAFLRDQSMRAEPLNAALFRELDTDGDGKLSKAELQAAAATLRKLDLNDDELITAAELVPPGDRNAPAGADARDRVKALADTPDFLLLGPDDPPSRLAAAILARYDKDQDDKLSRTEIGLAKAVFDQLDADHDGALDQEELARFRLCQPVDLEATIRLGRLIGPGERVAFRQPAGPGLPAGFTARLLATGAVEMAAGEVQLTLRAGDGPLATLPAARQFLGQQFHRADVTKRGYLDPVQVQQDPALRPLYPAADRDGDGRLTVDELTAYVDLLGQAVAGSVVLRIEDQGRNLFALLDTYHDGRLRPRELLRAWDRLAPFDRDGDGSITRQEVPHQFQIVLSQGASDEPLALAGGTAFPVAGAAPRPVPSARGPLWFRRMDRNGDGFVSPREFLGSKEDFQRIDTNGDGLISPEEAERYDAQLRSQANQRP